MSNGNPRAICRVSAAQVCGKNAYHSQTSMKRLKPRPRTKQTPARATRPRSAFGSSPPTTPQNPQASICQGVQTPWPRKKFEASAASAPTAKPRRGPRAVPATTATTGTGGAPGTRAKRTRAAAATPAIVAIRVRSFADSVPPSSQPAPATTTAIPARRTASPPRSGSSAAQAAAPSAAIAARTVTLCGKERLLLERDPAVDGEGAIVSGDEDSPTGRRVLLQPLGDLGLSVGIDPARRLVEDEQVRLGNGYRREP